MAAGTRAKRVVDTLVRADILAAELGRGDENAGVMLARQWRSLLPRVWGEAGEELVSRRQARKYFAYSWTQVAPSALGIGLSVWGLGIVLGLLGIALVTSTAHAQSTAAPAPAGASGGASTTGGGWLADRDSTQGPGFRVGDFELHPGIGVEVGYDSNLYYTDDHPDPAAPWHRVDTGILRVTPHLTFSTLTGDRARGGGEGTQSASPPTVTFSGGVSAAYYEFFADPNRRNLALDIGMRLTVLPQRPFGFSVYDTFSRQIRPFVENVNPQGGAARDSNNAGLQLNFQTDGGVLQVQAGYDFGLSFYEDSTFQYANAFIHTMTLQETYRFLPQTALLQDNQVRYNDYFNGRTGSSPVLLGDSWQVRSRVGLNGAITNDVSLTGMIGYAAGFFNNPSPTTYVQNYDGLVAQAQLSWQIVQGTRLALGYDRNYNTAQLGNYNSTDRGFVAFSTVIGGVFLLNVGGDVGYVDYGIIAPPPGSTMQVGSDSHGNPSRQDVRVNASIFAEYRLTDWLGINTTLRYGGDFTDYHYNVAVMSSGTILDPAGYNKFEAFLGVRVFY